MGHPKGKVKKVEVFEVNGVIFKTKEEADAYQKQIDQTRKENTLLRSRTEVLKSNARSLTKINGYYHVFNGTLFRGGEAEEAFTSMILDTPRTTLELLLSLDEREFEEDGPIKEELPIADGEFVEKRIEG